MEHAVTRDDILARVPKAHNDGINWHALAFVDKYSPDQTAHAERMLLRLRPHVLKHKGRPADGHSGHNVYNSALRQALERFTGDPEDGVGSAAGNLLTTRGLTTMTALLIGTGGSGRLFVMDTTHGACGVGNSATAAAIGNTDLTATGNSTTAWWQAMDSANPTVAAGVITGITTYASADGNFAWNEWGWASGGGTRTPANAITGVYGTASSDSMWNHKIASLGTKVVGASWVFTATITLS